MRGGACRKWRRPCKYWRTHCTRRSAQGDCALLKKKWRRHNRDNQQERAQPDRQRGGDGKRRDANAGTSGGGDGRAGVGLDRIPEVRTLRAKLKLLCQDLGRAVRWNAELAKEWIARQNATELYFYCDGHVRVYHGDQTALPRHYVARERLCLRATTDYWINAMDGQPFLYVNKEVDPGLIATLKQDVIPWLEANVAKTPEQQRRLAEDARAHWFTLVYDREGYSPELFAQMKKERIAILTYRKFPQEDWRKEEFQLHSVELAGGETVNMREHYGLDHLTEY